MKKDSSNNNDAEVGKRKQSWGGNVLGNRLNNISADFIFCVWGQYVFRVAENLMLMRSAS